MDTITIAFIEVIAVLGIIYFLAPTAAEERSKTSKYSYAKLIVFGFILLAMMVTNPSLEDHRQAIMDEIEKKTNESQSINYSNDWAQIGTNIGESIGKFFIDRVIERDNYLLFSVTTIKVNNAKRSIAIGIFGKVWIFQEFDKILKHKNNP